MSIWKRFSTKRKFLLPVIVTVALLVVTQAIRVTNYAKHFKNKPSTRAVLEVQAKETKEGLKKVGQFVELRGICSTFAPTTFYVYSFHHETRCNTYILVTSAPARASPPVCS